MIGSVDPLGKLLGELHPHDYLALVSHDGVQ